MRKSILSLLLLSATCGIQAIEVTDTLPQVVVTAARYATDTRYLPFTVSTITRSQLEQRQTPSILPLLTEEVPGLFTTSRGVMGYGIAAGSAGTLSLRGIGGGQRILVLIDGAPQYVGLMGHPISDGLQGLFAERVEVVRGPASVLYGSNAMGGAINIITRQNQTDGQHTVLRAEGGSYGTASAQALNQLRYGRFSSTLGLSYNRTDGHRTNMKFNQWQGYAKLGYRLSPAWQTAADFNLDYFTTQNPGTVTQPILENEGRIMRGAASLAVEDHYRFTSGALRLYGNWGRHRIADGHAASAKPLAYRFNSRDDLLGASAYQTVSLMEGNRTTIGFDYQHLDGEGWNQSATTRTTLTDKSANEVAAYADFRQTLAEVFTVDAGLRWDHYSRTGTEWMPQVGLSYQLDASSELKATVGRSFRNPTLRELFMFVPANADLDPEKMMNYELAYQVHEERWHAALNVFLLDADNLIQTAPVNGKPRNVNTGHVMNWGIELATGATLTSQWSVNANYSYLRMMKALILAAPQHKLYGGATYTLGAWSLDGGVQWIEGLYTSTSPRQTKNYWLLNLRASYRVLPCMTLYARGENLLAQKYETYAGFPMPRATVMGGVKIEL